MRRGPTNTKAWCTIRRAATLPLPCRKLSAPSAFLRRAEAPLLGLLSLVLPAIAVGNTVVAVPSERYPLVIGDVYQLFDTSDLPAAW